MTGCSSDIQTHTQMPGSSRAGFTGRLAPALRSSGYRQGVRKPGSGEFQDEGNISTLSRKKAWGSRTQQMAQMEMDQWGLKYVVLLRVSPGFDTPILTCSYTTPEASFMGTCS